MLLQLAIATVLMLLLAALIVDQIIKRYDP